MVQLAVTIAASLALAVSFSAWADFSALSLMESGRFLSKLNDGKV